MEWMAQNTQDLNGLLKVRDLYDRITMIFRKHSHSLVNSLLMVPPSMGTRCL